MSLTVFGLPSVSISTIQSFCNVRLILNCCVVSMALYIRRFDTSPLHLTVIFTPVSAPALKIFVVLVSLTVENGIPKASIANGKVNWEKVMKALADIDYKGELTFEADNFMDNKPDILLPDCARLMAKTGKQLISRFEDYKK